MKKGREIIGETFGELKVISFEGYVPVGKNSRKKVYKCICNCGNETIVKRNSLVSRHTRSCGCLPKGPIKHGLRNHPLYGVWLNMKDRCYNSNNTHYKSYGGRGIAICDEWKDDFQSFYDWSLENGWKRSLSIERKNNDMGYCPSNCEWIPMSEQAKNKSSNIMIEINGEIKNVSEWCSIFKVKPSTVYSKIRRGHILDEKLFK